MGAPRVSSEVALAVQAIGLLVLTLAPLYLLQSWTKVSGSISAQGLSESSSLYFGPFTISLNFQISDSTTSYDFWHTGPLCDVVSWYEDINGQEVPILVGWKLRGSLCSAAHLTLAIALTAAATAALAFLLYRCLFEENKNCSASVAIVSGVLAIGAGISWIEGFNSDANRLVDDLDSSATHPFLSLGSNELPAALSLLGATAANETLSLALLQQAPLASTLLHMRPPVSTTQPRPRNAVPQPREKPANPNATGLRGLGTTSSHHYNHNLFSCPDHPYTNWPGDGYCDSGNNYHDCYDGGDCCETSCRHNCDDGDSCEYTCGSYGYDCLDSRYLRAPPPPPPSPSPPPPSPSPPSSGIGSDFSISWSCVIVMVLGAFTMITSLLVACADEKPSRTTLPSGPSPATPPHTRADASHVVLHADLAC